MNAALLSSINEETFQQQILQFARLNHWRTYHTYDSRKSTDGFPDLVLVKGHRLLFAELKREQGKLSSEQARWLEALSRVERVSSHLWKPSNWSEIEEVLKNGR